MKADFGKEFIRTGAGKGDAERPVDRARFRRNLEQIDWGKPVGTPVKHKNKTRYTYTYGLEKQKKAGPAPVENGQSRGRKNVRGKSHRSA